MYANYNFYALQGRETREQELAERMAERRRQALATSRRPSLRAGMARRLFALAVAAERDLKRGLGGAGGEGRPMRRNSPQGVVGHVGMRFILLERDVERSDSRKGFTERGAQS